MGCGARIVSARLADIPGDGALAAILRYAVLPARLRARIARGGGASAPPRIARGARARAPRPCTHATRTPARNVIGCKRPRAPSAIAPSGPGRYHLA